jgi:hypothetical protein
MHYTNVTNRYKVKIEVYGKRGHCHRKEKNAVIRPSFIVAMQQEGMRLSALHVNSFESLEV